jgi:hypothetical protein
LKNLNSIFEYDPLIPSANSIANVSVTNVQTLAKRVAPFINRPQRRLRRNPLLDQHQQHLLNFALQENLESLTIPLLDQRMSLSLVERAVATLMSLYLLHRFLDLNEVAEILDIFTVVNRTSQLTRLPLEVKTITPQLLNLLSVGLPVLLSLTSVIEDERVSLSI